jgi:hypothetical protein
MRRAVLTVWNLLLALPACPNHGFALHRFQT